MPHLTRSVLLPFSAAQIFDLVADVPAYPDFVPGCVSAQPESGDDTGFLRRYRLGFRLKGLSESFVTENRQEAGERIHMQLLSGPFRQLVGNWDFQILAPDACKVSLQIELEIGNRMLEAALNPWIATVVAQVMNAFVERAHQQFGPGTVADHE